MGSDRPDLELCPDCVAKLEEFVDWRFAENRTMNITLRLVSRKKAEEAEEAEQRQLYLTQATEEPPTQRMPSCCPVCAYTVRANDYFIEECGRCGVIAHEPCFWRALPIEEWLLYIRWREEGPSPSTYSRAIICAECRQREASEA